MKRKKAFFERLVPALLDEDDDAVVVTIDDIQHQEVLENRIEPGYLYIEGTVAPPVEDFLISDSWLDLSHDNPIKNFLDGCRFELSFDGDEFFMSIYT